MTARGPSPVLTGAAMTSRRRPGSAPPGRQSARGSGSGVTTRSSFSTVIIPDSVQISPSERSSRVKEKEYWHELQPVGGRVGVYGLDVCLQNHGKHKHGHALQTQTESMVWNPAINAYVTENGPRKPPSKTPSNASSRRERRKDRPEPSDMPRAGLQVQPRTEQPIPFRAFINTLEFVPEPRTAPSVVSRASTDASLDEEVFANIRHHVGERLHSKFTTVQKAFRQTGAQPGSCECSKADMYNIFKANGYSRKVSDRFFNTMDKDRSGRIDIQEFNKHFGPAIQPEYEQEAGQHGYMCTTHNFFYDSKDEYTDPHERNIKGTGLKATNKNCWNTNIPTK